MKNETSRNFRGQAAMEYLMTYGWAILVVVIVLSVLLFYLPQFLRAPESCVFGQAGFTCSDQRPLIYLPTGSSNVNLVINVLNGQGKPVEVERIMCTTQAIGDVTESDAEEIPGTIGAGGTHKFEVECKGTVGEVLQLPAGSDFRGNFVMWYKFTGDLQPSGDRGEVLRQTYATISGPVLQQ